MLTDKELSVINIAVGNGVDAAKAHVLKEQIAEMKDKFSSLPEGKKTETYILQMAKASAKAVLSDLNKKTHALAAEFVKVTKAKE